MAWQVRVTQKGKNKLNFRMDTAPAVYFIEESSLGGQFPNKLY